MGESNSRDPGPITKTMESVLCGGWNEYCKYFFDALLQRERPPEGWSAPAVGVRDVLGI